jgi:hypothetical protein
LIWKEYKKEDKVKNIFITVQKDGGKGRYRGKGTFFVAIFGYCRRSYSGKQSIGKLTLLLGQKLAGTWTN